VRKLNSTGTSFAAHHLYNHTKDIVTNQLALTLQQQVAATFINFTRRLHNMTLLTGCKCVAWPKGTKGTAHNALLEHAQDWREKRYRPSWNSSRGSDSNRHYITRYRHRWAYWLGCWSWWGHSKCEDDYNELGNGLEPMWLQKMYACSSLFIEETILQQCSKHQFCYGVCLQAYQTYAQKSACCSNALSTTFAMEYACKLTKLMLKNQLVLTFHHRVTAIILLGLCMRMMPHAAPCPCALRMQVGQKLVRARERLRLNRASKVSIIYTWLVKTLHNMLSSFALSLVLFLPS